MSLFRHLTKHILDEVMGSVISLDGTLEGLILGGRCAVKMITYVL